MVWIPVQGINRLYAIFKGLETVIRIAKEENPDSPTIYRSQNSNYHIFVNNDGIWGIQPLLTNPMSYEVIKLTKDQVNRKTREEIRTEFSEDRSLHWTDNPKISLNGKYVAYISNKGEQGFQVWLIDIQQKTDQSLNTLERTVPEITGQPFLSGSKR